jgi:hypothetical protein
LKLNTQKPVGLGDTFIFVKNFIVEKDIQNCSVCNAYTC